jgi:hypothetical protein
MQQISFYILSLWKTVSHRGEAIEPATAMNPMAAVLRIKFNKALEQAGSTDIALETAIS